MLPLAGPDFPASLEELTGALRDGLAGCGLIPRAVNADGAWSDLSALSIDLTGASASRSTRFSPSIETPVKSVSAAQFTVSAVPLHFETTPLRFDLRAQDAEFGFARDKGGRLLLQLTRATAGAVNLEADRTDLENLLQRLAAEAAEKQGAQIKTVRLTFTSHGPRSLDFHAEITAKAFIMTAQLAVTGMLEVDVELNLRLHKLACVGDGMIANMAAGFLRPRFAEIEGKVFPLATFSFAGLKAHDVRLTAGQTLRLEAQFGD